MPPPLKFEDALKKLETMVKKLSEGEVSLDESLKIFEEGMTLAKFCETSLEEAEGKIEQFITTPQGEKKRVPFEA